MDEAPQYTVKVGDKVIEINEEVLKVLRKHVHQEMSLEQLAAELGLDSWEEAYEFIKKVPAWILWIPPTLWKTLKGMKTAQEELRPQ
ncbi:hypothetical protein [Stetteria hydrogenophila]